MRRNASRNIRHPGDFDVSPRILKITAFAPPIGAVSAGVAWRLLPLIGLITDVVFFQRFGTALVAPGAEPHSPFLILPAPICGGLVIGLVARFGSEEIRGHGIPEAIIARWTPAWSNVAATPPPECVRTLPSYVRQSANAGMVSSDDRSPRSRNFPSRGAPAAVEWVSGPQRPARARPRRRDMKINTRIAVLLGVLTLLVTPTAALAIGPEYEVEHVAPAPGAGASLAAKKKAYGVYCAGFPKKKAKGQKVSPYERCLTSMAKAVAAKKTPKVACAGFSKKHVKGKTGTEFSRCLAAAGEAKREGAL